jgi:chromosome segregation ATPase
MLALMGCDPEAQRQAGASEAFREAARLVQSASTGVVPEGLSEDEFRRQRLSEAMTRLDDAINGGSGRIKAEASRMKAQLLASQVDLLLSGSSVAMAEVSRDGYALLADLSRISTIRSEGMLSDIQPGDGLATLEKGRSEYETRAANYDRLVAEGTQTASKIRAELESRQAAASAAFTAQTRLENEATRLTGQARYDKDREAVEQKRLADAAGLEAMRLEEMLANVEDQLAQATRQRDLLTKARDAFADNLKNLQQRKEKSVAAVAAVKGRLDEANAAAVEKLEALVGRYQNNVAAPTTRAVSGATEAAALLSGAGGQGGDGGAVELLAQQRQLAAALTASALQTSRFQALATALGEELNAPAAVAALRDIDTTQLSDQALSSIITTLEKANTLASNNPGGPADKIAQSLESLRNALQPSG